MLAALKRRMHNRQNCSDKTFALPNHFGMSFITQRSGSDIKPSVPSQERLMVAGIQREKFRRLPNPAPYRHRIGFGRLPVPQELQVPAT